MNVRVYLNPYRLPVFKKNSIYKVGYENTIKWTLIFELLPPCPLDHLNLYPPFFLAGLFTIKVIFGNKTGEIGPLNIHYFRGLASVSTGMFKVQGDKAFFEPIEGLF